MCRRGKKDYMTTALTRFWVVLSVLICGFCAELLEGHRAFRGIVTGVIHRISFGQAGEDLDILRVRRTRRHGRRANMPSMVENYFAFFRNLYYTVSAPAGVMAW